MPDTPWPPRPCAGLDGHHVQLLSLANSLDGADEGLAHRCNHGCGCDAIPQVGPHEVDKAALGLKTRHIAIEIHPVDAFHCQHDMATDYFGDVLRYHALGLRVSYCLTLKVRSLSNPIPAWLHYHTW